MSKSFLSFQIPSGDISFLICPIHSESLSLTVQQCDTNPKAKELLIVPSQALNCSVALAATSVEDIFMNRDSSVLDLSNADDFEGSLNALPTRSSVKMSFGSCADRSSLPFLPKSEETHVAVIALRHAVQEAASFILRSAPKAPAEPYFKAAVYFFPTSFLFDQAGAAKVADLISRISSCNACGAMQLQGLGMTTSGADAKVATIAVDLN